MIRCASPLRYDGLALSGRNQPLRVQVQTDDGVEHDVFLKPSGRPELGIEGLANEALAACIATTLGLPITEPLLVNLDPVWVDAIADRDTQKILRASTPTAFGSTWAGSQWKVWAPSDVLVGVRRQVALEIFAFDAFIDNDDRTSRKPNCLVKGDDFRIIDHELAFHLGKKLFPQVAPWRPQYLDRMVTPDGHIFGAKLRGLPELDFDRVKRNWMGLTDAHLAAFKAAMPVDWAPVTDKIDAAIAHVATVRDRIDDCMIELRRTLG